MSEVDEAPASLSLGVIVGGVSPDGTQWSNAVKRLALAVIDVRAGFVADVNINIEFHVPGPVLQPDFAGVRSGAFRKKDRWLKIQAAVPHGPPGSNPDAVVMDLAVLAVAEAEAWGRRRRQPVDPQPFYALLRAASQRLV